MDDCLRYTVQETFENAYAKIFRDFMAKYDSDFYDLAHFVAMRGKHYREAIDKNKEALRLMLIGRVTNGWDSYPWREKEDSTRRELCMKTLPDKFGKDCYTELNTNDRFKWRKGKSLGNSRFWTFTQAIWEKITGTAAKDDWYESIALSNLYKISPNPKGDPDELMRALQLPPCVEILKAEIEELNPTVILMITGLDWLLPFFSIFDCIEPCEDSKFVKAIAFVKQNRQQERIPVIVVRRPEGRFPKNGHITMGQRREDFANAVEKSYNWLRIDRGLCKSNGLRKAPWKWSKENRKTVLRCDVAPQPTQTTPEQCEHGQ